MRFEKGTNINRKRLVNHTKLLKLKIVKGQTISKKINSNREKGKPKNLQIFQLKKKQIKDN